MALSDSKYSVAELGRTKGEMEAFLADEEKLATAREMLKKEGLTDEQQKTLKMLERKYAGVEKRTAGEDVDAASPVAARSRRTSARTSRRKSGRRSTTTAPRGFACERLGSVASCTRRMTFLNASTTARS